MSLSYHLVYDEETGEQNITVFKPGESPLVASSEHPNFEQIVSRTLAGDASALELFDIGKTVKYRFEKLSERVSVYNGHVFFDGDLVDSALTQQILRFLEEDVSDWIPLVHFMDKVSQNPSEDSRQQLYDWLQRNEFTLAGDGDIVGYKGVRSTDEAGVYESVWTGCAIVDGDVMHGHIANKPGSVVEMPRHEVAFDPGAACSVGLHVANFSYASGFGNAVLEVRVNPRDVVSVPTADAQKMRVCRYKITDTIRAGHTSAVLEDDEFEEWEGDEDEPDEALLMPAPAREPVDPDFTIGLVFSDDEAADLS